MPGLRTGRQRERSVSAWPAPACRRLWSCGHLNWVDRAVHAQTCDTWHPYPHNYTPSPRSCTVQARGFIDTSRQ
eukprot:6582778-Prymnesium_polylepis.1